MPSEKTKKIDDMLASVKDAIGLVSRLRGPNGCPWDQKQDHLTLRQYLIEEAHEVLDVLDRYKNGFTDPDKKNLKEELGDLLLQVLLHSELTAERSEFNFGDVCNAMVSKLVQRHPHVFGDTKVSGSEEVLKNWEALKKKVGKKKTLEGLPQGLPSLQRAARIGEKARNVGFDWKDKDQVLAKVDEELVELKEALQGQKIDEIEHELGDMFFALSQLSRHLGLSPEDVHRKAIKRFEWRFDGVEKRFADAGKNMNDASIEELEAVWQQVKKEEKK